MSHTYKAMYAPPAFITKLAAVLDEQQLRRVLDGDLYDLNDRDRAAKAELITAAKPVIISANEAMIAAFKEEPEGYIQPNRQAV